jgi:hypothetical protein
MDSSLAYAKFGSLRAISFDLLQLEICVKNQDDLLATESVQTMTFAYFTIRNRNYLNVSE